MACKATTNSRDICLKPDVSTALRTGASLRSSTDGRNINQSDVFIHCHQLYALREIETDIFI